MKYGCISFTSLLITSYQIAIPQLMFFGYTVSIYLTNNFGIYLLFIKISYYLTPSILKTRKLRTRKRKVLTYVSDNVSVFNFYLIPEFSLHVIFL